MLKESRTDIQYAQVAKFQDDEWQDITTDIQEISYVESIQQTVATKTKNTLIWGFGVVGGCFSVAAMAPKALPMVISYLVPSAAVPGIIASTTTSSVAVASYAFGYQVSTAGAEAAWSLTGSALTYLFSGGASTVHAKPKHGLDHSRLKHPKAS